MMPASKSQVNVSTTGLAARNRSAGARGFTLMEMMITVAIVGILAAIALPNYQDSVQRGKIAEASANLSDMRTRLEQYYLDHRKYPVLCIAVAVGAAPDGAIYLPAAAKYFDVTCNFPAADTYTITATGSATNGMSGFAYTINEGNGRRTTSLPARWTGVGNACWVTRRSGTC